MKFPEFFDKLNPTIKEDPCDISLYAMLKAFFDSNRKDMTVEQQFDLLDNLSKQTRYAEKANLFLSTECRKKKKEQRLSALEEFYVFCKDKMFAMINDLSSPFYCAKCQTRDGDEHRINTFEAIPMYLYEYSSGPACKDFAGLSYATSVKIKSIGFNPKQVIEIDATKKGDKYLLDVKAGFDELPANSLVLVAEPTLRQILRCWFKKVFDEKIPVLAADSKLNIYSFDISEIPSSIIDVVEENVMYDKLKVQMDPSVVSKELRKICTKKMSDYKTIEEQEKAVVDWAKRSGKDCSYDVFKNTYFPDLDPLDLLEMALSDLCYNEAKERIEKDAKKQRLTLPGM